MEAGEASAIRAVLRTRTNALYFHPNLLGITRAAAAAGEEMRMRLPGESFGSGACPLSLCAIATLVDVALTAAMRVRISPGTLIATASLSLQLVSHELVAPMEAAATAFPVATGEGIAACALEHESRPVGHALGHFLARREPLGRGNLSLPSDGDADAIGEEAVAHAELTAVERSTVDDVVAGARRVATGGTALSDELLRLDERSVGDGVARARMPPSGALANRSGSLHGAALFAAGASVAADALGVPSAFVAGHILFLGPAHGPVEIEASVIRRGRTLASTDARVRSGPELVVVARYEFRLFAG